jgi:hypothetical protein
MPERIPSREWRRGLHALPSDGSIGAAFENKLGGRQSIIRRIHKIDGEVLLDIADWLGLPEQEDDEEAAAA